MTEDLKGLYFAALYGKWKPVQSDKSIILVSSYDGMHGSFDPIYVIGEGKIYSKHFYGRRC